jgi:transcriptional regulator with XRE-family HTH domain
MSTLDEIRKKNGLSFVKFGERLGMNKNYLWDVSRGRAKICEKNLDKISKEFNEPLDELLIAYGYLPDYTKEARQKDSRQLNRIIKKASKKIMEEV